MSSGSSTSMRKWSLAIFGSFAALWGLYWLLVFWWIPVQHQTDINKGWEVAFARRGQFGDMFGGITAFFSALTLAGLIITIRVQQREYAEQARERAETLAAMEQQNKHLRDSTEQQVMGDLLRDYRSPIMMVAVKSLWDLKRETKEDEKDIAQEYIRLAEVQPGRSEALRPDLHGNRRLVSHFYQRLAGLWKLGVLKDELVFMFFSADDFSIIPDAINPIEEALSLKHSNKKAFGRQSFTAMSDLYAAAVKHEAEKAAKAG